MKADWRTISFDEAVEDASGGNAKTPQGEYLKQGSLPVVDQGDGLIGGYTNEPGAACRAALPVVIFGDHTRRLKYVDFPFGMGADGVKVLSPKAGVDAKYLYHYLRSLALPAAGYDRHFKYLKRLSVVVPPVAEQRRIAEVLDRAETLRAQRRQALAQLDALAEAIFLDMFGDPVSNPKRWAVVSLGSIAEVSSGSTPSRHDKDFYGGTIPWVKTGEVNGGRILRTEESLTEAGMKAARCKLYPIGSVVIAMYGQGKTRGRCAVLGIAASTNQACAVLSPAGTYDTEFLHMQLTMGYERVRAMGRGGNQENLNLGLVSGFSVVLPPLNLQRRFSRTRAAVAALKSRHGQSLTHLNTLFTSFQHRAFRGEL